MVIKGEMKIMTEKPKQERHRISKARLYTSLILGLLSFLLLLILLMTDPVLILIKQYTKVTNGSFVHELMMREMEGIHLSTYLFNVTNYDQYMAGDAQKLKVEEVGPFTYREMRKNVDIDIDLDNQRLRYTPSMRLEYVDEESIGKPEDFIVTVPNIPMLSLATMASKFSYFAGVAINIITNQMNSKPMVTMSTGTYLWGYEDPIISLAHTAMPGAVHFDKMGILDRIYDRKNMHRVEVSIADEEKFMIKKLSGYTKLKMGDGNPEDCAVCNTLENAYEGVGYPMMLTPEFPMRIFRNGLCRILDLYYNDTIPTSYGSQALVYHFNDSFYSLGPNDTNNGILALPQCFFGSPLAFSKPHFGGSDPKVYKNIDGIVPDEEKHRGWVTIDAKFGLTLETVFTVQVNLVVGDISSNTKGKKFSNMVLPICMLKIVQPPLPQESIDILSIAYVTAPYVILGMKFLFLMLMVFFWGYFVRGMYLNYILREDSIMSFPLSNKVLEINANNVAEPLMTQKVAS